MTYSFRDPQLEAIFARKQTNQAGAPIEHAWERTTWRRIISRHNLDLAFIAAIYLVAILAAIAVVATSGLMHSNSGLGPGLEIIFGTAVFGTFIELLRRTYDTAVKRLSTIDLFTSEILSIMRVFVAGNIIGDFVRLFDKVDTGKPSDPLNDPVVAPSHDKPSASGLADSARKENYLSIFEKNSSDLGSLDPAVVNDITAFYTFLRAARDATGSIQLWKEPQYDASMKKEDIVTVVYLCFLMTVHGRLALEQLIISVNNRNIVDDIFAGVQLQCFSFLERALSQDDFRRPRIEERRTDCINLSTRYGYTFWPPSEASVACKKEVG